MNKKYRRVIIAGNWKMNRKPSEVKGFVDAIENDTDPVVLPEQACVVSEILEAIYTSAKTGEPVYFNK